MWTAAKRPDERPGFVGEVWAKMMASEGLQWIGMVVVGVALVAAAAVAYLALLRRMVIVVPATILIGFAFELELQLRFTATLLGLLAILYLPQLIVALVWRQLVRSRAAVTAGINPPSALEMAYQAVADEDARDRFERQTKAARDAGDQDDRDARARDLERQGMLSLWQRL